MSDFSELVTGAIAAASAFAAIAAAVFAHGSREAAASANQLAKGLADRAAILELLSIAYQVQTDAREAIIELSVIHDITTGRPAPSTRR